MTDLTALFFANLKDKYQAEENQTCKRLQISAIQEKSQVVFVSDGQFFHPAVFLFSSDNQPEESWTRDLHLFQILQVESYKWKRQDQEEDFKKKPNPILEISKFTFSFNPKKRIGNPSPLRIPANIPLPDSIQLRSTMETKSSVPITTTTKFDLLSSLHPHRKTNWHIQFLVRNKSAIRSIRQGQSQVCSIDIQDIQGTEMRLVAFGAEVDQIPAQVEPNNWYTLRNQSANPVKSFVKEVDKRFNSLGNFEIMLNYHHMELLPEFDPPSKEDMVEPGFQLDYVYPIDRLKSLPKSTRVDILGLVVRHSPIQELQSQKDVFRLNHKLSLEIVDKSNHVVELIFWNETATDFTKTHGHHVVPGTVIAIRRARVNHYQNATQLQGSDDTRVLLDPECEQTEELHQWWSTTSSSSSSWVLISATEKINSYRTRTLNRVTSLALVQDQSPPQEEEFQVVARIVQFHHSLRQDDRMLPYYLACPTSTCRNKKVVEENENVSYLCQGCNQTFGPNDVKYQFKLNFTIADASGCMQVSMMGEECSQLLGPGCSSAKQIHEWKQKEENSKMEQVLFRPLLYRAWCFKIKPKLDTVHHRMNYNVMAVCPVSYKDETI